MAHSRDAAVTTFWDRLNIKVRIGSLLFDVLLNDNIVPRPLEYVQEKHNHAAYELQFIWSGSGTLIFDETEQNLVSGSIHLIGPNIFHAVKPDKNDPVVRSTLRFTFREDNENDPLFPRTESEQLEAVLSGVTYCRLPVQADHEMLFRLVDEVRLETESPLLGSYTNVRSLFALILVRVARAIHLNTGTNVKYSMPSRAKDDLRSHIIDIFFMGYRQNLTLEMLAGQLSLSTKQVNRLLKKYFQTSFRQKLLDTRIEVAKDLLRTSDLPIEKIAEEVGCASTHRFYYHFQQKMGMTPAEYRSRHQADFCNPEP
ncbi:helix-turn-helix domain-containing protein [Paenibacillus mesophilus]|uniref:AraC family transcriptional regulator n=1 Tax=Paenibacillus mesophilus TaxID=2582849 RepID=UPI00110E7ED4|nr:helix-turn-helix domain-containing protein [Paenibacillus mesophilus]TMV48671.1 helix-turn-helix domain-containing protein [Paenibacillus mesophilus]